MLVFFTSALIKEGFEQRKDEYIKSFHALKRFGCDPYIIESMDDSNTFLNDLTNKVIYPRDNYPNLKNKGANEAKALLKAFEIIPCNPEDMIFKITGRYFLKNDTFIKRCRFAKKDAVVKYVGNQIFTGCFAMKKKFLNDMLSKINYDKMENDMINFERLVADYISKHQIEVERVEEINIVANICGDGRYDLQEF